ncbi:transcriptional regulator [Brevibacillus sp. SAFN-007a]|uniref:transcriptional regulator n=1 Tax=Brevibacillus sp. SAFN-007a TaxID=3436862 RepID=UPI003F7DA8E6
MSVTKIRKGTFQHVESELYAYHETRKEIVRLKNEILYASGSTDENVGGGRGSLPGDPTSRTAILLSSHKKLEQLRNIVDAIESVVDRLTEDRKKLIRLRYWEKPQRLTWDGVAAELHVSRRTAMNWRDEIVRAIAEKIGWR